MGSRGKKKVNVAMRSENEHLMILAKFIVKRQNGPAKYCLANIRARTVPKHTELLNDVRGVIAGLRLIEIEISERMHLAQEYDIWHSRNALA